MLGSLQCFVHLKGVVDVYLYACCSCSECVFVVTSLKTINKHGLRQLNVNTLYMLY